MAGTAISEIYCWEISVDDLGICLASTRRGALRIGLVLGEKCDSLSFFRKLFPNASLRKDYNINRPLMQRIEAALSNKQVKRLMDIDFSFTPFQWLVLKAIATIPFGETRTYGEVGRMLGKPRGGRAVGQALGKNPLPLIFP